MKFIFFIFLLFIGLPFCSCPMREVDSFFEHYDAALKIPDAKKRFIALGAIIKEVTLINTQNRSKDLAELIAQCRAAQKATGYKPWKKWAFGGSVATAAALMAVVAARHMKDDKKESGSKLKAKKPSLEIVTPPAPPIDLPTTPVLRMNNADLARDLNNFFVAKVLRNRASKLNAKRVLGPDSIVKPMPSIPASAFSFEDLLDKDGQASYQKIFTELGEPLGTPVLEVIVNFAGISLMNALNGLNEVVQKRSDLFEQADRDQFNSIKTVVQSLCEYRINYAFNLIARKIAGLRTVNARKMVITPITKALASDVQSYYQSVVVQTTEVSSMSTRVDSDKIKIKSYIESVWGPSILELITKYKSDDSLLRSNADSGYKYVDYKAVE